MRWPFSRCVYSNLSIEAMALVEVRSKTSPSIWKSHDGGYQDAIVPRVPRHAGEEILETTKFPMPICAHSTSMNVHIRPILDRYPHGILSLGSPLRGLPYDVTSHVVVVVAVPEGTQRYPLGIPAYPFLVPPGPRHGAMEFGTGNNY